MSDEPKPQVTDSKQLTGIYKKSGLFDKQRRTLLQNFKESETHANLLLKLKLMVDNKVKNNPDILMKNKGKMAALIQGEIMTENNNSLLSIVDKDIQEKIIDSPDFHSVLKSQLKDVKRKQEGITDEEYAEILKKETETQTPHINKVTKPKVTKAPRFNYSSLTRDSESLADKKREKKGFHLMY